VTTNRLLDERLTEYRDNLLSIASQLEVVGRLTSKPEEVADAIKLYRLIAGDLTKVLDGEELRGFVVTGTLPEDL
jgi:hypothetical protein